MVKWQNYGRRLAKQTLAQTALSYTHIDLTSRELHKTYTNLTQEKVQREGSLCICMLMQGIQIYRLCLFFVLLIFLNS